MYLLGDHGAPQDDEKAVQYKQRACDDPSQAQACEALKGIGKP
jgi:TPR repeat protein